MDGSSIRSWRKQLGLSQAELGERLGVSQVQISCWETNKYAPSEKCVVKIQLLLEGVGARAPTLREQHKRPEASTSSQGRRSEQALVRAGSFVQFKDADTGMPTVGKVLELLDGALTVEIFRSPVVPEFETVSIPATRVEPWPVPRQTLVYQKVGRHWMMGRIVSDEVAGCFAIRFPNERDPVVVPSREVLIRSPRFADDPTTLIAAQVTSSPYFTEARHRFTEFVAAQRAAYRGLTALATASIELHLHQLAAVNRVLSDPVHRYLLADEVGLGKTIEAGLLIAQHLIDERGSASVVLVTPDALVEQWKSELGSLFGLRRDPRLRIVSFTALDTTSRSDLLWPAPTLVVVDEAHRSASWAFLSETVTRGDVDERRYRVLEELAGCPKLILISGTPVLHHEDGFLAMLHLLEPEAYELNDREAFRTRVAARAAIGDALAQLTADYQDEFLTEALTELSTAIVSDDELSERVRSVREALDTDRPKAVHAIEELRSYLLERYRLHRRIIRTHRESKAIANLLPKRSGLMFIPVGEDRARVRAFEALDDWRSRAADYPVVRAHVATIFSGLLSGALSHPSQLGRALEDRAATLRDGHTAPFFDGEASWLSDVAREFVMTSYDDDVRTTALAGFLREGAAAKRRAVIFVDTSETADLVLRQLSAMKDLQARVQRFSPNDAGCVRGYQSRSNSILVCDRSAEEGLNLQRNPATILFYDLPFDIGRVEQRIGRFDRLEGMKELSFRMAEPVGPYERGWAKLLVEHVRIFERSVARLQYVLSDALTALRGALIEVGPTEAFESIAKEFADPKLGLDAELKRLRRQEVLDATEWQDDELQAYVDRVSEIRETSSEEARDAIEGWLKELQFEVKEEDGEAVVYTHVQEARGRGGTLMPFLPLDCGAKQWLRRRYPDRTRADVRHDFGPFVFDAADQLDDASLLGLGHPFFETIFECMGSDDRSRSWAMWRYQPGMSSSEFYIRFDFSIEAHLADLSQIAQRWGTANSLRRRADSVLPVEHRTVWMDIEGTVITQHNLLRILERPYARDSAADKNLNAERWAVANQHVPVGDWGARMIRLRRDLEESVRGEDAFQRKCKEAEQRASAMEQHAVRILRSRAAHAPERERQALEAAIRFERELGDGLRKGVRAPALSIDNVGVILLSPAPFGE